MIFRPPTRSQPAQAPEPLPAPSPWETSVEVDLHLMLALSRASVNALIALSPQSAALVRDALAAEVEALQAQNDPHSLAAVGGVMELLQKAA
jgi:hypothetical protein